MHLMTDQEFQELSRKEYISLKDTLQTVLDNQVILGKKLNELQADMATAIRNQQIMGNDQDELIKQVKGIERLLNK